LHLVVGIVAFAAVFMKSSDAVPAR
jgi:hypothetical protein